MPSFDVVSKVNTQEIDNAVNNATKEINTRFDFKNSKTTVEWDEENSLIKILSSSDGRVTAALDVLQSKVIKRGISIQSLKPGDMKSAPGGMVRQDVAVQQGIEQDAAKKMIKDVKDAKLKVQGSIQGDQVRFTGKNRDDLQEAIALLKENDYELPLQFVNFRD
ncbi:MAG: YajQ family cyclic di-GMP-binding protein [Bradymonadaceae bacterium]